MIKKIFLLILCILLSPIWATAYLLSFTITLITGAWAKADVDIEEVIFGEVGDDEI